jgi:hypothetical protein
MLLLGIASVCAAALPAARADPVGPPARIANIYGGLNHQPTRSEVEDRQRAAGVRPGPHQESVDDAAVQQLFEELTRKARSG